MSAWTVSRTALALSFTDYVCMDKKITLELLDATPEWFQGLWGEIDSKRFGDAFDACLLDVTQMMFGVAHMTSREAIRHDFKDFGSTMDTRHVFKEFWDLPSMKVVRGEVTMTRHDTGHTVTPIFVHILKMSASEVGKIEIYYCAVGPGL